MTLLVDIGNSRIKWARLKGGKPVEVDAMMRGKTGIKRGLSKAWKNLENVERVVVANVGGLKIAEQLKEWTQNYWQVTPEFLLTRSSGYGVRNAYPKPETLGIDRWLTFIAIRQHYRGTNNRSATYIVDCGSAITVDVLAADGNHLGGLVIPGLNMMPKLLVDNTAGIDDIAEETEYALLASTTHTAVNAGTLYAAVAFIDRVSADIATEIKGDLKYVITGGDASKVAPLLRNKYEHIPDLVLWGLARVARDTQKVRAKVEMDCAT